MKTLIKKTVHQVTQSIYQQKGFDDRNDYLIHVAGELDLDFNIVSELANFLGKSEDFDDLLSMLEGCRF